MKSWSGGVAESWSVGSIRSTASLQNSNTPTARLQLKIISLALCALLFALCLPADAQQPKKVPRIGFLLAPSRSAVSESLDAFRQGLHELGYVEGQSIVSEYRYAEGNFDRLGDLAAELVGLKVDVIVAVEVVLRSRPQKKRLARSRS